MVSSLTLLALASGVIALQVTSPSKTDVWTVGDSETITWSSVDSDQDSFNIYLSNMARYPTTSILLASDISTSEGSHKIDGSKLTAGDSYTINFTNGTKTEQIYAQSNQFNITAAAVSSSSSSSSSSTSSSASSSGTGSSSTTLITSTSSTAASSSASSSAESSSASSAASSSSSSSQASSTTSSKSGKSSSAAATGTSSDSTASATGTGAKASATKASSNGAGKVAAGWMGLAAVAALAL